MDNLDTSDVLLNRGLNGYYGMGARGYNGNFTYDGSVVNANVKANRDFDQEGRSFLSRQISSNDDRNRDIAQLISSNDRTNRLADAISTLTSSMVDKFASQTQFVTSQFAGQDRQIQALREKVGDCCCDVKQAIASVAATQDGDARVAAALSQGQTQAKLDAILSTSHVHGQGGPGN